MTTLIQGTQYKLYLKDKDDSVFYVIVRPSTDIDLEKKLSLFSKYSYIPNHTSESFDQQFMKFLIGANLVKVQIDNLPVIFLENLKGSYE